MAKTRLVRDLKVGQSVRVGDARIFLARKDGQQVRIVVEADESLPVRVSSEPLIAEKSVEPVET